MTHYVVMLLPLQGVGSIHRNTQGDALGYGLQPFQGVLGIFNRTVRKDFPLPYDTEKS